MNCAKYKLILSKNPYYLLYIVTCPKRNTKKVQTKTTKLCVINNEKCFIHDTKIKFGYLGGKSVLNEPKKVICSCIGKNPNECRSKYCENIRAQAMK